MELDFIFNLSSTEQIIFLISLTALALAVIAIFSGRTAGQRLSEQNSVVKYRVDSLWEDMNAWQASQFNGPAASGEQDVTGTERFSTEKTAYEAVWPLVWALHDKLGAFLRAVEAEDNPGDLRLEARNAALDARRTLNRVRPFCHGEVDELITQLIDNYIKAHLAACHFIELRKDSAPSAADHEMAVQKEKFHMLYDGQAREMLDQLVTVIRGRMLR